MAKIQLGTIVGVSDDPRQGFERCCELGVPTCQLVCTAERLLGKFKPEQIRAAADATGIEISSFFILFEGQVWDRFRGFPTMGMVAPDYREQRVPLFKQFADMVNDIGLKSLTSHIGFIPDDPHDPVYVGFIEVMKDIANHLAANGQSLCFETGQELPSTLKRTILDVGTGNLFVNLDPANLILYGKAYPLDAVEIFGEYVRGMHAKDGIWPNRDDGLGEEKPLGEGEANLPVLLPLLKSKGFRGPITIEREIHGPQQTDDIRKAMAFLEPYLELGDE
ncbi:MAG: xylose isomerase [Armatimonadetes bacterium CG_4_10_14_3_um_filter_66_18]|nr:sugar phosphate isomerase/epimerase [Armatimonadota bacterium]PIU92259.1 MAG: xylose isomerase [Armatimonadetes bacterium CG06_land_8_20_14_3_00_66_21]PIX40578.1 MAG: xylose isomerase [Armatimonadetes bacterium CG_4_8_14_3_um_filter_66_20]PIY48365.1 MAG: xylose isomerase [Armatimonadetes bacterium CG_4_10_14_3_um_filter_66_18]PIZ40655.1 MAG: xylose isomerase [Armatimonadetes bacterium CG_4_10_14_0_8_um_filter_66_14]PJB67613.1 MAG: xylose isomerase [Armatimonadetes bacterium CG_4_9_14_3_um_f